jgi:transglutaminase-like putative cysteine protease
VIDGPGIERARRVVVPTVLIALITSAALLLGRIYEGPVLTWLTAGAGAGAVLVGALARRLPNWQVAPLSTLLMAGYLLAASWWTARHAQLSGTVPQLLADAAANGVPRLLTAMIPVEAVPDTVVVPVVASWITGLAAAEIAVRGRRMLLGCLPPLLLFGAAVFVVGPNAAPARWPAVLFVVAAALGLAVTAAPAAPHRAASADPPARSTAPVDQSPSGRVDTLRLRSTLVSMAGAGAVLLVVVLGAPLILARVSTTGVDPRRYVTPPQVDTLDENPLIRISGWALNPDQPLFDLQIGTATDDTGAEAAGSAPPTGPVRLRLAVLHDYDGVTWRVGGTYRNAGRVLPPPADESAPVDGSASVSAGAAPLRQQITIAELTGRLLPAMTTPTRIDGVRVAYDAASGTLLHPEGLTSGVSYRVDSVPAPAVTNALVTADVPAGDAAARVLRVADGVPDEFGRLARQIAENNAAPYQRALALEQFLAEHYRLVADAPSGHAYPNLGFFLLGPREAGGQRGTSEQFAAAFAVLGRLIGLPTRVVVGFVAPAGGTTVQGVHAVAWPEVLFSGIGWVPFDPLPRPETVPRPIEEEFRPAPVEPTPPVEQSPPPPVDPADAAPEATAEGQQRPLSGWVIGAVGAAAVLAMVGGWAVGVFALRRRQHRRRLTGGGPADRIAGAWLEVADALRLAGHPAAAHLSATEVARHARSLPGADALPALDPLADLVNVASFAPGHADQGQAHAAGGWASGYVDALRAHRPWWRRVIWSLHPGPLHWRRQQTTGSGTDAPTG